MCKHIRGQKNKYFKAKFIQTPGDKYKLQLALAVRGNAQSGDHWLPDIQVYSKLLLE